MDDREALFLASQAERLAHRKPPPAGGAGVHAGRGGEAPELVNETGTDCNVNSDGVDDKERSKEQSHRFWKGFRGACAEFQRQIDELLLLPPPPADGGGGAASRDTGGSNEESVRAYYATASRRNEGRTKLDSTLHNVRSLQRHVLSSSSSVLASNKNNEGGNDDGSELLRTILQNPMPEVTQTDTRLLSQEIDRILKRIDAAREIICPKEKFVFRRYRRAMEERERVGNAVQDVAVTEAAEEKETKGETGDKRERERDNLRSQYGGVLENMSNCTIEISADGEVRIDETTEEELQCYSSPRPIQQPSPAQESASYLLQHLQNVTVILHGARPSLHLQHLRNCKIYVAEPTLGPVHATDCHASEIRCSCHQLRVHESTDVHFGVWARSGPIIEDSCRMLFSGDYFSDECGSGAEGLGRNMYWDVKDFNWLRALRQSPNFTVIEKAADRDAEKASAETNAAYDGGTRTETCGAEDAVVVQEEDSEDEL